MIVECKVSVGYSEIRRAVGTTWGPRAWVAMSLVRFLTALGIGIDYAR